jgi:flagellar protein FlaI
VAEKKLDLKSIVKKMKEERLAEERLRRSFSREDVVGGLAEELPKPRVKGEDKTEVPSYEPASLEEEVSVEELEKSRKAKVKSYGQTTIYKIPGRSLLHYEVPVPRPTASEKAIIATIREAATRLISVSPYRIRDPEQRRNVYFNQIMDILRSTTELNIPKSRFEFYANAVVREMVGYGLIDPLIKDDDLEEIMVIGPKKPVYVFHRQYEMMTTNIEFYNDDEVIDLINRIARVIGRRVDISAPLLDARLPDGSRVNATIAPASVSGSTLTIRKFRKDPYSIVDLVKLKTLSPEAAAFLWLCVDGMSIRPANVLIAGGTGSGKTTTLNILAAFIPDFERIISIEDTAELNLPLNHWIRLEARPPGLEERGELTMDILTKNALRMRPDRIIVGEVRHKEAFTLFTAMNTGHDGSMGTIHANTPEETIVRIISPPMNVPELMLAGLNFIVVENRLHDKLKGTIRRITEISEVRGILKGKPETTLIFKRNPAKDRLERTQASVDYFKLLQQLTGLKAKDIERDLKQRQKVLEDLASNNIRRIDEIAKVTAKHLLKRMRYG